MFSVFRSTLLRVGCCGLLIQSLASAAFPSKPGEDTWANRPNDPHYHNMWNLFSHLPKNHVGVVSAFEKLIGSGVHADKAWQWHVGSPDTVIAVLDSGIYWDNADLLDHFFLNREELPFPEGHSVYDVNADGRFNVKDYAGDSRLSDTNQNGVIDPGDLIAVFSNGIDEDNNGYIDDISGWDFHELDNNPHDRTGFGHGTSEAEDSAAILNNGIGVSGICGNCSVVPIRVNDSFIIDAQAFAEAVIYSTDLRVSLIQQALGSVNNSPYVRDAVNYAYDNGVPIIGSAADENSFHHNYPSTLDPVIYANAIRYDTKNYTEATTFLNFNNCSNYGARVDVTVPGRFCSSEATGILSGVASLVLSYAKSVGKALSPLELNALIRETATDIALGPNDKDPQRHPTYAGWDTITGAGRANAHEMILAINADKIPPVARIVTPHWFEVFSSSERKNIEVSIEAAAPRKNQYDVALFAFRGVETSESQPLLIKKVTARSGKTRGVFGSVSLSQLETLPISKLDSKRNERAFTLVLKVTDSSGTSASVRRTVFVAKDPWLRSGFPAKLVGSGESSGFFADINSDGKEEFITGDGAGFVHAFTGEGTQLPGFPAATSRSFYGKDHADPVYASIVASTAGGDLDGDGSFEIVAASYEGHVSVIEPTGKMREGFPVTLPRVDPNIVSNPQVLANGVLAAPVLVDLDNDNQLEIVVVGYDGVLYAIRHDGKFQPGFPVPLVHGGKRAKIVSSPAVFDLNQDGIKDLVLGSNHQGKEAGFLFAVDGRGNKAKSLHIKGFPVSIPLIRDSILPTLGVGIPTAPVIADFDGDKEKEILIHAFVGKSYLVSLKGKLKRSLSMKLSSQHSSNDTHMISGFGHPAVGDLDGDGVMDPVTVGVGKRILVNMMLGGKKHDFDPLVSGWSGKNGKMLEGYPKVLDDVTLSPSAVVADLTGDGKGEVIVGSGGYYIHAFSKDGEAEGFPHFTGGWSYGAPAVGDIDGDGKLEVAATTREGYLFVWKTNGEKKGLDSGWATFKGSSLRQGLQ